MLPWRWHLLLAAMPGTRRERTPLAGRGHGVGAANRKARVLVVEDSIGVRELQRVILEGAGYDVMTAVDGSRRCGPARR